MNMANVLKRKKSVASADAVAVAPAGQQFAAAGAVTVARGPIGDVAVDADHTAIVVTNPGDNSVSFVSPQTMAVIGTVPVFEPLLAAVTADRAYVTATAANCDVITVIDTATKAVIAEYPLAFSVTALAVSPDGKRVFAGRTDYDRVDIAVIDTTAERAGTIEVATGPGINLDALLVDPSGKRVYAATSDARGSRLMTINAETAKVVASVGIGAPIRDLALDVDGRVHVLTSDRTGGGAVDIVDAGTNKITGSIGIGPAPVQMALNADGSRAYVVDFDHVTVLCTLTGEVVGRIETGARPSSLALSADGAQLVVADYAGAVASFTVASAMPLLYSQFLATDPIPAQMAELEPA